MAKKVDHAQRAHSELPPSSSNKWMFCYGWRATVAQHYERYGRPGSSAAADEGTKAHEKFERHLMGLESNTPDPGLTNAQLRDWEVMTGAMKSPVPVDDPDHDDLIECLEWVEKQEGLLLPETRMDFGVGLGYEGLTGTVDVTIVNDDELIIADLKFGRGLVEVRDEVGRLNTQLMTYLVGAINKFGTRPNYRIVILQPRAWHKDGPIRGTVVTQAELAVFMFDLENAIEGSYKGGKCTTGPWCHKYCDALASCRAVVLAARQRLRDNPVED